MKKNIIIIISLIVLVVLGVAVFNFLRTPVLSMDETQNIAGAGTYVEYSEQKLTDEKSNVIFFFAKWCPSCQRQHNNLEDSRGDIPENVVILRADFDNSDELRQKYGVTRQHTFVQVDGDGNEIKQWNNLYDSYDLESILNELE